MQQGRHDVHCTHGLIGNEHLCREHNECNSGNSISHLADYAGKTFELQLQRSLEIIVDERTLVHLTILGGITYKVNTHYTVSVNDRGTAQYPVRRVSSLAVEIGLDRSL